MGFGNIESDLFLFLFLITSFKFKLGHFDFISANYAVSQKSSASSLLSCLVPSSEDVSCHDGPSITPISSGSLSYLPPLYDVCSQFSRLFTAENIYYTDNQVLNTNYQVVQDTVQDTVWKSNTGNTMSNYQVVQDTVQDTVWKSNNTMYRFLEWKFVQTVTTIPSKLNLLENGNKNFAQLLQLPVRNRCVIKVLVDFLYCPLIFFIVSDGIGSFVIELSQIFSSSHWNQRSDVALILDIPNINVYL